MKKHNELNLKFNGNMALASNSFSKALAKFDKETSTEYVLIVYAQNNKESEIHSIVVNSPSLESCYKIIKNIKKDRLNITSYSIYENSNAIVYENEEEDCKFCPKNERQGDEVYSLCRNLQGILPCGQQNCWFGCTVCIENGMDDHCDNCINN